MTSYNIRPHSLKSKICSSFSHLVTSKLHFAFCFFLGSKTCLSSFFSAVLFTLCTIFYLFSAGFASSSTHTFFFQEILGLGQQTSQQPGRNHTKRVSVNHQVLEVQSRSTVQVPRDVLPLFFAFFLAPLEYYIKEASIFREGFIRRGLLQAAC